MTLNRLILIKTAKNIVMFINNNAFIYGLTSSIKPGNMEPGGMEPSIVRRSNVDNKSSNNKSKSATYFYNNNPSSLTVDINFLDCHFNDNR